MKKIAYLLTLIMLSFSLVHGESPITQERTEKALHETEEIEPQTNFYSELMNIIFILALVVFFMIVATYYLRKYLAGRMEQMNVTSNIKITDQRNLSAKTVLYVVEAYGKRFLLGESAAGVIGLGDLGSGKAFEEYYNNSDD